MDLFGRKRIAELEQANINLNRRLQDWEDHWKRLEPIFTQGKVTNLAVARIIAKLDPEYGRSEFDAQRKRESDILGDQIICKLLSEHRLSNPTNPNA